MAFSFLNPNESYLKRKQKLVSRINELEEEKKNLSQEEIQEQIKFFESKPMMILL